MRHQQHLDFQSELIVDLFAGGGGTSTGIEMAIGRVQVADEINAILTKYAG